MYGCPISTAVQENRRGGRVVDGDGRRTHARDREIDGVSRERERGGWLVVWLRRSSRGTEKVYGSSPHSHNR